MRFTTDAPFALSFLLTLRIHCCRRYTYRARDLQKVVAMCRKTATLAAVHHKKKHPSAPHRGISPV